MILYAVEYMYMCTSESESPSCLGLLISFDAPFSLDSNRSNIVFMSSSDFLSALDITDFLMDLLTLLLN